MKIILAAKSAYPFHPIGGVQKYVYYLAKHLHDKGIDVEIVAPLDSGKSRTEVVDGIPVTLLWPPIFRYLEYPVGWLGVHIFSLRLAEYLKNKNFDLLHSFDMVGYRYLKSLRRNPVIAQIFSDNYLTNPIVSSNPLNVLGLFGQKTRDIKRRKIKISPVADSKTVRQYPFQYFLKTQPMNFLLNAAESVFLEDKAFQQEVMELFCLSERKCRVLPVGVDISFISTQTANSRMRREDIGLKQDDVVLITVNRLAADKGVDKILLSLPYIRKEIPNVKLIVVGEGYQKKELLKMTADAGLTREALYFHQVSEEKLYGFYKLADIYVSAFSYPGSSVSTLEAMACGLPIITTAQPWLVPDGLNGIYIEDNDSQTISRAVIQLAKRNQLKRQGEISREIVGRYDWRVISDIAIREYQVLLSSN